MVDLLYIVAGFILLLSFGSTQYEVKALRKELDSLKQELSGKLNITIPEDVVVVKQDVNTKYQWGRADKEKE